MPNRARILITTPIESIADFYTALGEVRNETTVPAPRNLDALADFIVDAGITRITAAEWKLDCEATRPIINVLHDNGAELYR